LLALAELKFPGQYIALQAGVVTLAAFAGLTLVVATTGKDFSFLRPILMVGSFVALGVIICALLFGAAYLLGAIFSGAMILLAAGYILYSTSNVMLYYSEDQYVAAALELFAAVALMFYYVLRLFLQLQSSNNN
jgi:FtsH-binding integral membrane protein